MSSVFFIAVPQGARGSVTQREGSIRSRGGRLGWATASKCNNSSGAGGEKIVHAGGYVLHRIGDDVDVLGTLTSRKDNV